MCISGVGEPPKENLLTRFEFPEELRIPNPNARAAPHGIEGKERSIPHPVYHGTNSGGGPGKAAGPTGIPAMIGNLLLGDGSTY